MKVLDRFLKYVSFDTASDEQSETCPSSAKQRVLGEYLANELKEIGLSDVCFDKDGYVYGFLPASAGRENESAIGFIAHMDTCPDVSGKDVKPEVIRYDGGDITLKCGEQITTARFPFLSDLVGKDLVVTDGTTLLGADDKAGVAEIFSACEYLIAHPECSHRAIAICITPDEEIGRGADRFDFSRFAAKEAYTIDGGALGEIEYENFNAAAAQVQIKGVNIHPGEAKNKMKNAALLASEFISRLPASETPAHTEGYEGFYHVCEIGGDESSAFVTMIIRDHDREKFLHRKQFIENLCEYLNSVYGEGTFTALIKDSYYNMKEKILPFMYLIDNAKAAFSECSVEPKIIAIRGGTDGARLSYEGLPCPNLSTGGYNFHSVHELIPVESLSRMVEVIVKLAEMRGQN